MAAMPWPNGEVMSANGAIADRGDLVGGQGASRALWA
jgi:hypothetical protein